MGHNLNRIKYADLNSRQKENFNYHKLAAVLVDYGYSSIRLSDDWNGADLISQHVNGIDVLRIQLKGRLTFKKSYINKNLWLAFPYQGDWFLYPHDKTLDTVINEAGLMAGTSSWEINGGYSFPSLGLKLLNILEQYRIYGAASAVEQ